MSVLTIRVRLRRHVPARGHVTLNLRPHQSSAPSLAGEVPSSIHMEGVDTFHLLPLCERTSLVYDVFARGWCDIVGPLSMLALTVHSARVHTHAHHRGKPPLLPNHLGTCAQDEIRRASDLSRPTLRGEMGGATPRRILTNCQWRREGPTGQNTL